MSNVDLSGLNKKIDWAKKVRGYVMDQAYQHFRDITPVKTGNAKRNTRKVNDEIHADYPYAGVLDKGRHMTNRGMRGSTQAPRGMSFPTIQKFGRWISQYLRIR